MRRVPMILSAGNAVAGMAAVVLISRGYLMTAGLLILLAAVMDAYDGKIARCLGVASSSGANADMLADLVSFGIAPCFLVWHVSHESWKIAAAAIYLLLIVARLLRFRLRPASLGSFHGLPSPSAALPLVAVCLLAVQGKLHESVPTYAAIAAGAMAISRIPYPGFSHPSIRILPPKGILILFVLDLAIFFFRPVETVLVTMMVYIFLGPILLRRYQAKHRSEGNSGGG